MKIKFLQKIVPNVSLSKREKFVSSVFILSSAFFFSEVFTGLAFVIAGGIVALATALFLYISLREDIKGTFYYPLFVLPFLYALSFELFYSLVPARTLTRLLLTVVFAFGLYSLYLTQNIFAVSGIRTINLLRSARIVSFVITIFTMFSLLNVLFSLKLPIFIAPILVGVIVFLLAFESLWSYALTRESVGEVLTAATVCAISIAELAVVVAIWPVNAVIYAIFLTGIFYTYSGLSHAWMEKRLFKGILWEYVWVGFLSVLILILFSQWGI